MLFSTLKRIMYLFFFNFIYFRQRMWESTNSADGQSEKDKQTPCGAGSPTQGSILRF